MGLVVAGVAILAVVTRPAPRHSVPGISRRGSPRTVGTKGNVPASPGAGTSLTGASVSRVRYSAARLDLQPVAGDSGPLPAVAASTAGPRARGVVPRRPPGTR